MVLMDILTQSIALITYILIYLKTKNKTKTKNCAPYFLIKQKKQKIR